MPTSYRGRFAPSPTGPLHAGSLVAALASWLDARAHAGAWLLRIEDIDPPREVPGAAQDIVATLAQFGMESDEPVLHQSTRGAAYQQAFDRLRAAGRVYGCACSRKEIDEAIAQRPGWPAGVYPGACRAHPPAPAQVRAWRFAVSPGVVAFTDRHAGRCEQDMAREVGDFALRRADGLWAYQLAVVVDDAAQGITDVVRGADLLDNTPRQIVVQQALGLPTPKYLHVRVVVNERGEKLSKQTGAAPLDLAAPLVELERAAAHLRLPQVGADSVPAFLCVATALWAERHAPADTMVPT